MRDLIEHAPVVCAFGRRVNARDGDAPGILAAVTALPQFRGWKAIVSSATARRGGMKRIAEIVPHVDEQVECCDSQQKQRNLAMMRDQNSAYVRPLRWLVHLPLAILPCLAAAVIDGPRLGPEIGRRVEASLVAAGQSWAKPLVSFRDVEIRGEAPDRAAAERARAAVAGTEGVRRVDMHVGIISP